MTKYKCGHEGKPIFVNNDLGVFAEYQVWRDRNNGENCFLCFLKLLESGKKSTEGKPVGLPVGKNSPIGSEGG